MLGEGSCRTAEKKVEKLNKMTKFFFTPCILFYFDSFFKVGMQIVKVNGNSLNLMQSAYEAQRFIETIYRQNEILEIYVKTF